MATTSMLYVTLTCYRCGDKIQSHSNYDFRYCKCGTIAIDGGAEEPDQEGVQKNHSMRFLGFGGSPILDRAISYEPKISYAEELKEKKTN